MFLDIYLYHYAYFLFQNDKEHGIFYFSDSYFSFHPIFIWIIYIMSKRNQTYMWPLSNNFYIPKFEYFSQWNYEMENIIQTQGVLKVQRSEKSIWMGIKIKSRKKQNLIVFLTKIDYIEFGKKLFYANVI